MSVDYPRAFQIIDKIPIYKHDENCSYRETGGGIICDCHVLTQHKEFLSKKFYGKNGKIINTKPLRDRTMKNNKVYNLYKRKKLKGRLFKNIHTGKLFIVRFVRSEHIYYAGDGFKSKMIASSFANCFIKVA